MDRVANSRALGFGVFAIAAWLYSMAGAGFMPMVYGQSLHGVAMIAAIGLLIAGIASFLRREPWLGFFFILWSAVAWSGGVVAGLGWLWLALALINFYLWLGVRRRGLEPAIGAIAFLVAVDALGQGLFGVVGLHWAGVVGTWFGLAAALVAFYVSATSAMSPDGYERAPGMHPRAVERASVERVTTGPDGRTVERTTVEHDE
ncbi:MAG: hypothetical protein ACRESR_06260 [Gammaproteobacteria bacterium]